MAGKTGTAQIPVRGGYRGYLPSFVGFAPADRPALVGLVAIAEPQGNEYYGAQVAAPAFSAIVRQVLLYRGVHPERDRPTRLGRADDESRLMLAKLTPATARRRDPAVDVDDSLADGDDHEAPPWRSPRPRSRRRPRRRTPRRRLSPPPREAARMRLSELARAWRSAGVDRGSTRR